MSRQEDELFKSNKFPTDGFIYYCATNAINIWYILDMFIVHKSRYLHFCRSTWRTGQDGAAVVCREVWFAHTHLSLDVGLEPRVTRLLEARVALLHLCLDVNASSCHQHWHFSVSLGSSRMWGKEYKVCTIAHVRFSLLIILSLNSEWWLCPISWVTSPSRYQSVTSVSSWDPGLSSGGQWQWWGTLTMMGTSFQIISSACYTRSSKSGTLSPHRKPTLVPRSSRHHCWFNQ